VNECNEVITRPVLGRLFDRVDLIKPVSNIHPSIRKYVPAYIGTYVHKHLFDFNEIWRVDRG